MLSLGPISAPVDLINVLPKTSSLNRICPEHSLKIQQRNICPEGHGVDWNTWLLGQKQDDGSYKVVTPDSKPEFEADVALSFVPVPRDQLESTTIDGSGIYYCKPSSEAFAQAWATLRQVLSDPKVALVTKAALRRGQRHLYRLTIFNDYLVLREVVFPEKVAEAPEQPETKLDRKTTAVVKEFVGTLLTDLSKFDTTDDNAARLQEWLDSGQVIAGSEAPTTEADPQSAGDMLTLLTAAVEAAKK